MKINTFVDFLENQDYLNNEYITKVGLKLSPISFITWLLTDGIEENTIPQNKLSLHNEFLIYSLNSKYRNDMNKDYLESNNKIHNSCIDQNLKSITKLSEYFTSFKGEENYKKIENHLKDPYHMSALISESLKFAPAYSNWLSILNNLLTAAITDKQENFQFWIFIDSIVQQILENQLDFESIQKFKAFNETIAHLKNQLNSLIEENLNLKSKLTKKEAQLKEIAKEKNQADTQTLYEKLHEYPFKIKQVESDQSKNIEPFSGPNDQINESVTKIIPTPPPMPLNFSSIDVASLNFTIPPAPPLPPMGSNSKSNQYSIKIPVSKVKMKYFNWIKIPNKNYTGSLWTKLNEENLYEILNLEELESAFSAYQNSSKNIQNDEESWLSLSSNTQEDSIKIKKEYSVIDNRRATNLQILLANLKKNKLTNEKLEKIILNMDTKDELPRYMIEQLLRFVPTTEEENLLKENKSEFINLAEPDKFLFDMSTIFHYKEKLEILYFIKKYNESFKELKSKMMNVTDCCNSLLINKNIPTLLNIVLCFGNFMNQGHANGTVKGFSISNLNKLIDIKSSNDSSYTLLHYLVDTIQKKIPRLMNIFSELESVRQASNINIEGLQNDWKSMETGFNVLLKELTEHKLNREKLKETDQFINVIEKFQYECFEEIRDLKSMYSILESHTAETLRYYGEDHKKNKFEEFLATWNKFLNLFNETLLESHVKKKRSSVEVKHKFKDSKSIKFRARSIPNNDISIDSLSKNRISMSQHNEDDLDSFICAIDDRSMVNRNIASKPKDLGKRRVNLDGHSKIINCHRERIHSTSI